MDLSFYCQACINSYKGMYGEVKPIFQKEEDFSAGVVQGLFADRNDGILYLIFQGSIQFRDWVNNFRYMKRYFKYHRGSVHIGFLDEYEIVRQTVLEKAMDFKEIQVIGHSMGGALASMCALDLAANFGKSVTSVTFGSPRVGNQEFVNCHDDYVRSIRVVNGCDLVPRFPKMGYSHVSGLVEVGAKKWYRQLGSIVDHDPRSYLASLS